MMANVVNSISLPAYRLTGLPAYRLTGLPAYRLTGLPIVTYFILLVKLRLAKGVRSFQPWKVENIPSSVAFFCLIGGGEYADDKI